MSTRSLLPFVPFVFALATVAGCDARPVVTPRSAPTDVATASTGTTAPIASAVPDASAPRADCLPKILRESGVVTSVTANLAPDSITFGMRAPADGDRAAVFEWLSVDKKTGAFSSVDVVGGAARSLSATGTRSIERKATEVTVCMPNGDLCKTIKATGFTSPTNEAIPADARAQIPADVSRDGERVFLIRNGNKVFGETYEVATGRRLARVPIEADGHVTQVWWIGKLALITTCVEAGPGCSATLIDPRTGKKGEYLANLYAARTPVQPAGGATWAIVDGTGASVVFVNADTGNIVRKVELPEPADVLLGVTAESRLMKELVIVYGGPVGGKVVILNMETGAVTSTFEPPSCK